MSNPDRRQDRTINILVDVPGTHKAYVRRGGTPLGVNTYTYVAQRTIMERTPSGGPRLPYREKPFLYGRLEYQASHGSLVRPWGGGDMLVNEGWFGPSVRIINKECWFSGGFPNTYYPDYLAYGQAYPPPINPDLLSQAEVKALNRLGEVSGEADFQLGLFYAERRETYDMFRTGTAGVLDLLNALRKGNVGKAEAVLEGVFDLAKPSNRKQWANSVRKGAKGAKATAGALASTALTWNLGVSPLLQDLDSLVQRVLRGDLSTTMAVKAVGKVSRVFNDTEDKPVDGFTMSSTNAVTHGYTCTLVAAPIASELAALSRLGLTNPPALAYQATSGTFIVDYFVALGPWLDSLAIPQRFRFVDGSWTHRYIRVTTWTLTGEGAQLTPGKLLINYTRRYVYSTFPVPIPPLSLRGKDLADRQVLNTGLVTLQKIRSILKT